MLPGDRGVTAGWSGDDGHRSPVPPTPRVPDPVAPPHGVRTDGAPTGAGPPHRQGAVAGGGGVVAAPCRCPVRGSGSGGSMPRSAAHRGGRRHSGRGAGTATRRGGCWAARWGSRPAAGRGGTWACRRQGRACRPALHHRPRASPHHGGDRDDGRDQGQQDAEGRPVLRRAGPRVRREGPKPEALTGAGSRPGGENRRRGTDAVDAPPGTGRRRSRRAPLQRPARARRYCSHARVPVPRVSRVRRRLRTRGVRFTRAKAATRAAAPFPTRAGTTTRARGRRRSRGRGGPAAQAGPPSSTGPARRGPAPARDHSPHAPSAAPQPAGPQGRRAAGPQGG